MQKFEGEDLYFRRRREENGAADRAIWNAEHSRHVAAAEASAAAEAAAAHWVKSREFRVC